MTQLTEAQWKQLNRSGWGRPVWVWWMSATFRDGRTYTWLQVYHFNWYMVYLADGRG